MASGGLSGQRTQVMEWEVENERSRSSTILSRVVTWSETQQKVFVSTSRCIRSLPVNCCLAHAASLTPLSTVCLGKHAFRLQPSGWLFSPHRQDPTDDIRNELARTPLLASCKSETDHSELCNVIDSSDLGVLWQCTYLQYQGEIPDGDQVPEWMTTL
jgi:hypothetical protein